MGTAPVVEESGQVLEGDNSLTRFSNTVQSTTQLPVLASHAPAAMGTADPGTTSMSLEYGSRHFILQRR